MEKIMKIKLIYLSFPLSLIFACTPINKPKMDESASSSEENRSFYDSSIFGNWNNNKELVNKIKRRLSTLNLPSAVVGVVSRDVKGLIFTGESSPRKKPDENTIYPIGSITKVFTGLLSSQAIIENKIHLNTRVSDITTPNLAPLLEERTVAQLLSHYAGYRSMPANLNFNSIAPAKDYSFNDLLLCLKYHESCASNRSEPGDRYTYSNLGSGLLYLSLSHLYNVSPINALDPILKAFNLSSTRWVRELSNDIGLDLAIAYDRQGNVIPYNTMGVLMGAGELTTSGLDLLKLMEAFVFPFRKNERTALIVRELKRPIKGHIAFSIDIKDLDGDRIFKKDGATPGSSTVIVWNEDENIGAFVMTNIGGKNKEITNNLLKPLVSNGL